MGSPDIDPGLRGGFDIGMSSGTDNLTESNNELTTLREPSVDSFSEIDPQTLNPEQYSKLDPLAKKNVDLTLLRLGDEKSVAKLAVLEPGFEMQYPLSYLEGVTFSAFEDYVKGGIRGAGFVSNLGPEVAEALDLERQRREVGDHIVSGHKIDGFKMKRWERWKLEEQIRQEREALEKRKELPKAA